MKDDSNKKISTEITEECFSNLPLGIQVVIRSVGAFSVLGFFVGMIVMTLNEPRGHHTLPNIPFIVIYGLVGIFLATCIAFAECRVNE
jgi:hypothetical protein